MFFLVVLMISINHTIFSQAKTSSTLQQTWFNYFNQTRFSDKWGMWADLSLRTKEDFLKDLSQSIIRVGLTYYIKDNTKLTAGYAYVNHFPQEGHEDISQTEHRPWQQLQWHTRFPRLRTMQWLRLEERYRRKIKDNDELAEGYNFNWRARHNLMVFFPLNKKAFAPKTVSLSVNNEVLLNFGKQIRYNTFDQNRLFAGFNYHTSSHDFLQFGYMNVYQQLPAGNKYRYLHVARISYFQNLDLRKKESPPKS